MILVRTVNLTKYFTIGFIRRKVVKAVDNVNIHINEGEVLGVVGESGAGKTTLCKLLLGLIKPTSGSIIFENVDITHTNRKLLDSIRRKMAYIPQHPETALDPRWKLYDSLAEPIRIHKLVRGEVEEKERVLELADLVGLKEEHLSRYPYEVSGGELQRAIIARALSLKPRFIICDEPTSMLDPSTQALILNLLKKLQEQHSLSLLFVTHDPDIATIMSHRIAVMYSGMIIEIARTNDMLEEPLHPYTQQFVSTVFKRIRPRGGGLSPNPPTEGSSYACPLYAKCPKRMPICKTRTPPLVKVAEEHYVACHAYNERPSPPTS